MNRADGSILDRLRRRVRTLVRGGNRPVTDRPDERVDERDTMFARAERTPGTDPYEDYYERRPDLRETDDRIREKPELGSPETLYYDPAVTPEADHYFESIEGIEPEPAVVREWVERLTAADEPHRVLRDLADALGAVDVGCTEVPQEYVYTEKGRFDENYGESVDLDHDAAVVFLVEMDFDEMQAAPKSPVIRESARQYYRAARIAKTMAAVLEAAGYDARPQYDAHYEVVLPPLAVEAGLGELGRNNILVADKYGSRVRIGAVTTDLSLPDDDPVSLGVERFCRHCKRCATQCPSQALTTGEKVDVRGTEKWPTDDARCYSFWRQAGTDCAICMANCPFSHRNTPLHNAVRLGIKWAPWLAPVFLSFDELVYDREPAVGGGASADDATGRSSR
ncbi:MAG: reductive dehalogenase [Halobacteriales archaeon]|jgi:reductive dehalogenase